MSLPYLLFITIFSAILFRNSVGVKKWAAVIVGMVGVLIILRPGTEVFQIASLLPLVAALAYALVH